MAPRAKRLASGASDAARRRARVNRDIRRLAIPSLGSLIVEPLFLAVDSAMIGHLGAAPLASVSLASTVLVTVVGLMVFLAYSTTPAVARLTGAGDRRGSVSRGIDGLWFALGLGVMIGAIGFLLSPWLISLFVPDPGIIPDAVSYLSISMLGLPAMLVVYAATGMLRGLQDAVSPLWVAGLGFTANAGLNAVLIYGLGWGVTGSAIGTVIAQWGMVAAYVVLVTRLVRSSGARVLPQLRGVLSMASSGGWLFLRTVSLRVAVLATVWVATGIGTDVLAGWQIVFTLLTVMAFALDALAIAAQALIGTALGAANTEQTKLVLRQTRRFGVLFGVLTGAVLAAVSPFIGLVFTGDERYASFVFPAVLIMAVTQPLAGWVFVLDGVLMGAGDTRYLAIAGALTLVVYLPTLVVVWWLCAGESTTPPTHGTALALVAGAYCGVFMLARGITLGWRVHTDAWLSATGPKAAA